MQSFDWIMPRKIMFGEGRIAEVGAVAAGFGKRVLLVTGGKSLKASGRLEKIFEHLDEKQLQWLHVKIEGEPAVEAVDALTAAAREFGPEVVVAAGGGSVMDAGKAVAALLTNGGSALDYLEGVGNGSVLKKDSLPVIAAPTTAGTGCEATKNAVIGDRAKTYKKSMRSDTMMPAVALVDPELTYDCPPDVAAACGMDALTQLLEARTSRKANAMSEAMTLDGIIKVAALFKLAAGEDSKELRADLSLAALYGGISLANVGLGAVHGLVSPLGAFFPVPHGAGCAAMLPAAVRANTRKMISMGKGPWFMQLQAYGTMLELWEVGEVTTDPEADAYKCADWLTDLNRRLKMPGLSGYGITPNDFPKIVAGARGNSMKTNPVDLTDEDLTRILEESL